MFSSGHEADCTVEKCFVDDEDEPEDNGEVMWDSEDEEYIYFPSIWRSVIDDEFSSGAPRYECFDDSGRRVCATLFDFIYLHKHILAY